MTRKQTVIIIVLAVVVLGGLIVGIIVRKGTGPIGPAGTGLGGTFSTSTLPLGSVVSGTTVLYNPEIPKNATATVPVQAIAPAPDVQNAVGQNVYNLTAAANGYIPTTLTIRQGDMATINFTSKGAQYDAFSANLSFYITAPSGETKTISFIPSTPGQFSFTCRSYCPSGGSITGTIIVLPK
jgi:heme/copper-type cytochrome/quinol oxidase subunit 2